MNVDDVAEENWSKVSLTRKIQLAWN